jgi:hypothetical protein
MYQVRVRDGVVRYSAYATREDAQKYLVHRVCNLKGFQVVTENEKDFVQAHLKDVIVDVYACDILTNEFSIEETLLIPQCVEWLENAKIILNRNL